MGQLSLLFSLVTLLSLPSFSNFAITTLGLDILVVNSEGLLNLSTESSVVLNAV